MVTEKQKYLSGVYRNIGFALLAPLGSILFQWFAFEKSPYFGHFVPAVIVSVLGILLIATGYKILREN